MVERRHGSDRRTLSAKRDADVAVVVGVFLVVPVPAPVLRLVLLGLRKKEGYRQLLRIGHLVVVDRARLGTYFGHHGTTGDRGIRIAPSLAIGRDEKSPLSII